MGSQGGRYTQTATVNTPRVSNIPVLPNVPTYTSMPYCAAGSIPSDKTFNISAVAPLVSNTQDAATIAAEVSAAAAAQALREFRRMHEPKITKLKGGYSADAELIFRSWRSDILAHIMDRELDNKVAIQLIKEQTLDNACHEVEFQLDLCGGEITCQDLLKHLSVAFQGGDNEASIFAKFYSLCSVHSKESEEVFADELQLLARKVISKKPDFSINLDTMLKQWYANQLYDCNSASIAKTLLLQMLHVSFTQFRNELARVLGTHQHFSKSVIRVSRSQFQLIGAESEEEEPISKSQCTSGRRRSVLSPLRLRTSVPNWMAQLPRMFKFGSYLVWPHFRTHSRMCYRQHNSGKTGQVVSFWVSSVNQSLQLARMGELIQRRLCNYCKDMGHNVDNCLCLQR